MNPGPRPYQGRALPLSYSSALPRRSTPCRRAGEGNRTLVTCLEGRSSTIELHPQQNSSGEIANRAGTPPCSSGRPKHLSPAPPRQSLYRDSAALHWAGRDSNPRRAKPARFTVWCHWPLGHLPALFLDPLPANGPTRQARSRVARLRVDSARPSGLPPLRGFCTRS